MQGRTLILVTHHVESVLNHCAYVVRLQNGSIEAQGTVEELRSSGHLAALQASTAPEPSPEAETPAGDVVRSEEAAEDPKAAKKLVETEAKAIGSVKIRIYLTCAFFSLRAQRLTNVLPCRYQRCRILDRWIARPRAYYTALQ